MNNEVVSAEGFEWLSEVNSMVRGEAFKDFGLALTAWKKAQRQSRRNAVVATVPDKYKPRYKKKGKCIDSARIFKKGGSEFKVLSAHRFSTVRTQKTKRLVFKTCESVEFLKSADIKNCTFSREAGLYYISICYEKTNRRKSAKIGTIGIDLGIKSSIACYDGNRLFTETLPTTLKHAQKRTEKLNKQFSRTEKGSKRHLCALLRVQKAYKHEQNIKKDFREKLTTALADEYNLFKIDDFGFKRSFKSEGYLSQASRCFTLCFQASLGAKG